MGAASDSAAAARLVDAPCPSGVASVESSNESVAAAVEFGASVAARGIPGAASPARRAMHLRKVQRSRLTERVVKAEAAAAAAEQSVRGKPYDAKVPIVVCVSPAATPLRGRPRRRPSW